MGVKYQAFAWDIFPNGAIKGVAKIFNSLNEAGEWLKIQPQAFRLACPNSLSKQMFELIQGDLKCQNEECSQNEW